MNELKQHEPVGYNPSSGILASSHIFTGDWENELNNLNYTTRTQTSQSAEIAEFDKDKGIIKMKFDGYSYTDRKFNNLMRDINIEGLKKVKTSTRLLFFFVRFN